MPATMLEPNSMVKPSPTIKPSPMIKPSQADLTHPEKPRTIGKMPGLETAQEDERPWPPTPTTWDLPGELRP